MADANFYDGVANRGGKPPLTSESREHSPRKRLILRVLLYSNLLGLIGIAGSWLYASNDPGDTVVYIIVISFHALLFLFVLASDILASLIDSRSK